MSALQPGDTVLGMNLSHGGHLTHGHPLNFSGRMYKFVAYGVKKDDELIDYDELDRLAQRTQAKNDRSGRQRLLASHRFRADRQNRQNRRGFIFCGHGPHRRTGSSRRPPESRAACGLCFDHDPQNIARPTRWIGAVQDHFCQRNSTSSLFRVSKAGRWCIPLRPKRFA